MSTDRQQVSYGHTHVGVGVNGYRPPKDTYEPSKHNGATPLRSGSQDAFKCPSLDAAGNTRPYWANKD